METDGGRTCGGAHKPREHQQTEIIIRIELFAVESPRQDYIYLAVSCT